MVNLSVRKFFIFSLTFFNQRKKTKQDVMHTLMFMWSINNHSHFADNTDLYLTGWSRFMVIIPLTLSLFWSCLSPGRRYLCWVTATTTSRISPTLQSATSSSPSCTRRWKSTRCTTPSPCTKLELIPRPPRPPSCSTTRAVTPRYCFVLSGNDTLKRVRVHHCFKLAI